MPGVQHLTRTGQFRTTVADLVTLSPRMRRITLTDPAIAEQRWPLGCDIAIVLAGEDREVRRRYTVRSSVGDRVVVDAVLHGHGPGSTWAQQLAPGDEVRFFGPRGEIPLPEADWLLALTDESGLPAVAALAEAAAAGGRTVRVLAEIAADDEHYPLPDGTDVQWLVRGDQPAGGEAVLAAALAGLSVPAGDGYAYILGESRVAVSLRDRLGKLGLHRTRVYAKGYWNLNSRPTR